MIISTRDKNQLLKIICSIVDSFYIRFSLKNQNILVKKRETISLIIKPCSSLKTSSETSKAFDVLEALLVFSNFYAKTARISSF